MTMTAVNEDLADLIETVKSKKNTSEVIIGFTGSQDGMTDRQHHTVTDLVTAISPSKAHHGDCIGSDATFHSICRSLGIYIVGHPGMDTYGRSPKRAHCDVDEMEPILPYLERNENVVNACTILIATPRGFEEELRSGTWSTIRNARRKTHSIYIVFPDGSVSTRLCA